MGNCSLQNERGEVYKEMGKCDFTFKQIIGRGGFGKVSIDSRLTLRCGEWRRRRKRRTTQ